MEWILIIYALIAPIVAMGQIYINGHLYGDNFTWDYLRLGALWPLVVLGFYK